MIQLSDVTHWYTHSGVSHIVVQSGDHYTYLLCEALCSGDPDESPPEKLRICRKCRANMKDVSVVPVA